MEALVERGLVQVARDVGQASDWLEGLSWGYIRVTGLGRARLGLEDLLDIADACRALAAGYCIFDLGRDEANVAAAKRLRGLLQEPDRVSDRF